MATYAEVSGRISQDQIVQETIRGLAVPVDLLAIAAQMPRLMLVTRAAEQRFPEHYNAVEGIFREQARRQASLIDESGCSRLLARIASKNAQAAPLLAAGGNEWV